MVRVLLADMSKAFDRVDHAQLLQHLANIELCPRPLAWEVPVVTTTKYLGFHLDSDLSGDTHIEQVVRKASKRLHFLTVLARHGLPCEDLVTIYTAVVRPCLEYGSVLLALFPLTLYGTVAGKVKASHVLAKIAAISNPEIAFPDERVSFLLNLICLEEESLHNISNMNRRLLSVFPLMFAINLSVSSSIRASQSGKKSAHKVLACMNPGCAANVTQVYCNNILIFNKADIPDCKSILEPMKVCKCGGRAFVNTTGDCDFEGEWGNHIDRYPGGDSASLCGVELQNPERSTISSEDITAHTSSSPTSSDDLAGKICGVFGGICLLVLLGGITHFCLKRRNKRQDREPTDEPAETVVLGDREAADGPVLDDDNPLPQPDRGG
ncbi:uncharacterized protein [Centroberyx affinis]|uniref:uncharacterized protein n=1 Tax=Centroberyx affinis TaxID=166261 RepID=UPI003A5C7208